MNQAVAIPWTKASDTFVTMMLMILSPSNFFQWKKQLMMPGDKTWKKVSKSRLCTLIKSSYTPFMLKSGLSSRRQGCLIFAIKM